MSEFRLPFREDMKKELNEFRGEINRKLQEATGELQATTARVAEAEQRISDITWITCSRRVKRPRVNISLLQRSEGLPTGAVYQGEPSDC